MSVISKRGLFALLFIAFLLPIASPIKADTSVKIDLETELIKNRLQLGVQFDYGNWQQYIDNPIYRSYLKDMNCKMVRIFVFRQSGIGGIEGKGPCLFWNSSTHSGLFEWENMDKLITKISSDEMEPLLCLMYPYDTLPFPRNPNGIDINPSTLLPYPDDWAEYCRVWVERYGDRVKYWEIFNEPYLYWHRTINWTRVNYLMELYETAYNAMKQENPDILISHDAVQIEEIFDYHQDEKIPFDYLDFHNYGIDEYESPASQAFDDVTVGYKSPSSGGKYGLNFSRAIVGNLVSIMGESNFNSAWKEGSDPRNQKMEGAVFSALQIINAIITGSDYRLHFHMSSTPSYNPRKNDWSYGFGMINNQNLKPWYPWYVYRMIGQSLFVGDSVFETFCMNENVEAIAWKHNTTLNILLIHKGKERVSISFEGIEGSFNFRKIDSSIDFLLAEEQTGSYNISNLIDLNGYTVILFQSENYFENGEIHPPLDAKADVKFVVQDKDGNPVSGASLKSLTNPKDQEALNGFTDSEGIVIFSKVIPGNYTVQLFKNGYLMGNSSFNLTPEEIVTFTIVLEHKIEESSASNFTYWLILLGLSMGVIFLLFARAKFHNLPTHKE